MNPLRILRFRGRALLRKARLDQEAEDEMRFHIEMLAKEHVANGLSEQEALRRAKIEFGGLERMKEYLRDARGVTWVENVLRDARLAFRQLRKSPAFAIVAVATLAIGIGACAAMFSVMNTALIRPLPFKSPEELVWIQNYRQPGLSAQTTRVDNYLEWKQQNTTFSSMGAYFAFFDYATVLLSHETGGGADRLRCVGITDGFLDTLGVSPILGRDFNEREYTKPIDGLPYVVILDNDFWKSRFDADPNIIGRQVTINGQPCEIVGVMPPSFNFDSVFSPGTEVQMFSPFPTSEETTRWGNTLAVIGRLKPGVPLSAADAELKTITERVRNEYPNTGRFYHEANSEMLDDRIRGPFRPAFYVLGGAVACVLLIACVNISNLLIARANTRRFEFALRAAIGGSRRHLIRQNLVEGVALAALGFLAGVPLAVVAVRWIAGLKAFSVPMLQNVQLDLTALGVVSVIALLAGILCGLFPALQLSNSRPADALREESQKGSGGKRRGLIREILVVVEVSLACLLLIAAGLLIRSFEKLIEVDPGFEPQNAIAWRIDGDRNFSSGDERVEYYNAIADRIAQLPEVSAVGLTDTLPMGRNRTWGVQAKGEDKAPGPSAGAYPRMVSHGYADSMGIEVLEGRFFNEFENGQTQFSAVINESLAKRLWDDQSPLGKIIGINGAEAHVIGVVENVKHSSLDANSGGEIYLLMRQVGDFSAVEMVVRSGMPTGLLIERVRAELKDIDRSIPQDEYRTLEQIVDRSIAPQRLIVSVLSGFSLIALFLAAIGLYGVISYLVSQRSKEIGIRMAIGAGKATVMRMVMFDGAKLIIIGLVIGLAASAGFSRLLASLLFEVSPTDTTIFASITAIVGIIALVATAIPASHATRIDPVQALR